jgi:hypothetical protein
MRTAKLLLLSVAICIGLVAWVIDLDEPDTQASTFCAYGKVFVRFKEGGKIWGTILLDNSGVPVPCQEGSMPSFKSLNKGNTI